jgi:hypothetical protein
MKQQNKSGQEKSFFSFVTLSLCLVNNEVISFLCVCLSRASYSFILSGQLNLVFLTNKLTHFCDLLRGASVQSSQEILHCPLIWIVLHI